MIPLMTTFSALMGLIFTIIWGAYADSRKVSRFGRRRPFLLGGIAAGLSMIFYLFSTSFWLCFIIDVIIIGILANSFVAARSALVPEMTELEERGRVNSRISIISGIFSFAAIALFFIVDSFFWDLDTEGKAYLNYQGHAIILIITGLMIISISLIGFFKIKENPEIQKLKEGKWYSQIKNSFQISELKKHKEFLKIIFATTVFLTGTKLF
ncbi:MAG: MFS transporter, partial [Candidatus Hodarchaeota archaeon]